MTTSPKLSVVFWFSDWQLQINDLNFLCYIRVLVVP